MIGKPKNDDEQIEGDRLEPPRRRMAPAFRFFDEREYEGSRGHPNDVDIWVDAARLYVRLSPSWRKSITQAANRFRAFRGAVQDETMVLHYHDKFCDDVLVVSRKRLVDQKGRRIAIHDGERDIFVLLPEDLSRRIVTEAMSERRNRDAGISALLADE